MNSPVPLVLILTAAGLAAQPQIQAQQRARKAISSWIAAHKDDREALIARTVTSIDGAGKSGIAELAAARNAARKANDKKRLLAVQSLIGHLGIRWFDKVEKSKLVFAGQYNDLQPLMPDIGDYYFTLLVQTPEWFSINERIKVIPALRDLYPKGPDDVTLDRVEMMATDEKEPAHLRVGLAYAMAQWGHRKLIKSKIHALQKKSRGDNEEIAIFALRDLSEIYYKIRDYSVAAVSYREFIERSEKADEYLVPVHYYNAACCMCLSGDRRSAMEYLRRCLKLNNSSKVDSSVRMVRSQFENDPEIALVRSAKGFKELMDTAFGEKRDGANKKIP
jgi:tetratricopeptide (TPR) repeat protein